MSPIYFEGKLKKGPFQISLEIPEGSLQELGLTYFSYGLISQNEVVLSYFTHEEWGHLYQEKHYNRIDPLLRGVVYSHLPLILWDALHPHGQEKQVMAERNDVCKLQSGLTIGITNKGCTEIIALGSEIPSRDFYHLLKEETYTRKIYDMISKFYKLHKEPILH